jgi:integrase
VRLHIVPALGHLKLTTLRPDAVQKLYGDKLAEGLSPGTIAKIHVVLHRALHMAEKWGYIVRNPADNVDKPNAPRPQVHPPDPADLIKLINTAVDAGDHLAPLWTLAVYSGCRAGELLGLGWQDVDFERGMITIRRTLVRTSQLTPQFGEPKSATSRRTVTLPAFAVNALRALKAREDQERASALDWADNGLVFCSHVGTPLLARNVIRDYKKALKRAGLPETIRFHDLRHAHATVLLRAGVPLKVASGRLGHSSIGITANLYQHLASDMDRDAAERIAQVLQP